MAETNTSYVPPALLSDMDDSAIHARMMGDLPPDIDATMGGFAWDFTAPAAIEKAGMMISMNEVVQMAFPMWSYGVFLDQIATSSGLNRRPANQASGELVLTGVPGTVVPMGLFFATPSSMGEPNIIFESMESATLDDEGMAAVDIRAVDGGTSGNTPANGVTLMVLPIPGIEGVTNPQPITGGVDAESDDSLRERIHERDMNFDASFVGNHSDYKRWAQEVPAVGAVSVIPEWEGPGTGSVKIVAMDSNGQPANELILAAVYDHIMAPEQPDLRLAPIGAILAVVTATVVHIDVSADVNIAVDHTRESVVAAFTAALNAYFAAAKEERVIRYTRIASALSETPGVLDFDHATLLVNGAMDNIPVDDEHFPSAGEVDLAVIDP